MKLIPLEFKKIKNTTMYFIITSLAILPVLLVLLQYLISSESEKKFYTSVADSNIVITMCLYTASIILANFIITREYRDRTMIYLFITPQSRLKILVSKFELLFISLFCLGTVTYGGLLILNLIFGGTDSENIMRITGAWIMNIVLTFLLMPFVVMIALWRKNFISSMLISLVLVIFTTPFMFTEKVYAFPHLIPMTVSMNILTIQNKLDLNYPCALGILGIVCVVCMVVSIKLFSQKK